MVIMEGRIFGDIVRGLILLEIYLTSVCVGSSPCMPDADPAGRYTVSGGGGNIWSDGILSGSRVQVSIRCDQGAIAQPPVVAHCVNGTWLQPWPRCEKPCSVPRNRENVRQFVNGLETMPISEYTSPTLQDGTRIVARCRDPGKFRLSGDQQRTCYGGQWTGVEPQCHAVSTQVLFYHAKRQVASNGTVIVFVYNGDPRRLNVKCKSLDWRQITPRLTTPLANDNELTHWHQIYSHTKQLYPIAIEHSGTFTCSWRTLSHSVHVLFKAAECDAPTVPEHGRLRDGDRTLPRAIIPSGTTVSFVCEEGYRLVGSRTVKCQKGQWTDVPPMCAVNRCPELSIPDNALMEGVYGYGRNIGDERIFHCRDGYVLRGDTNNLRCLEGGVWSDVLPRCEEPPSVDGSPSQAVEENNPVDSYSFPSVFHNGPKLNDEESIEETTQLPPGHSTRTQPTSNFSPGEGETTQSTPTHSNRAQPTSNISPEEGETTQSTPTHSNRAQPSSNISPGEGETTQSTPTHSNRAQPTSNISPEEGETTQSTPTHSNRTQPTSQISPEEGGDEGTQSTPADFTGLQRTSQALSRSTRGVTAQSSNSSVSVPAQPSIESTSDFSSEDRKIDYDYI